MKRAFTISLIILFIAAAAPAQITLNSSDVVNIYSSIRYNHSDTLTTSVNIGAPGGNNIWNFSSLLSHNTASFENVSPAATPYIADFPSANLVTKSKTLITEGQFADYYAYVNLSDASFTVLGGEMGITYQGFPLQTKMVNNPGERSMIFPATYNTQWVENFSYTLSTMMGGMVMNSFTEKHTTYYTIDAYGTLTVPGGATTEALRIKKDTRYILTRDNSWHRRISYEIMTKNGLSVAFHVVDTLTADHGTITVDNVSWSTSTAVGVKETGQLPLYVSLSQNYPNPFNPATILKYDIPEAGEVELKVYDMLGREVAALVNQRQDAGSYNVSFDASRLCAGIYLARLHSGSYSKSIKMNLIK